MAKIVAEEQKDFAVVPDDSILLLKVEEVKVETVQGNRGPWDKMEIKFKVLGIQHIGDGGDPEEYESLITGPIWGGVPFKLTDSAENKLRLWTEAILGVPVGIGFELDTDLFLNREVRGVTGTYPKKTTNPATGEPFLGHKVLSLLPKDGSAGPASLGWGGQQQSDPWATQNQPPPAQNVSNGHQQPGSGQPPANDPWATPQGSWDDEPPF